MLQSLFGTHTGDPNTSVRPGPQRPQRIPVRLRAHGEMPSQGQGLCDEGWPSQQYISGQAMKWTTMTAAVFASVPETTVSDGRVTEVSGSMTARTHSRPGPYALARLRRIRAATA